MVTTDIQKLKPDLEAAREFAEKCQRNAEQFPRIAIDAEGRVYFRRADGYHQNLPSSEFPDPRIFLDPDVAKAHGLLSDDDSAITYVV